MMENTKEKVPIWEKALLTVPEASEYFGIGEKKIRELAEKPNCKFVLWNGSKCLIKRRLMNLYIENEHSI